MGAKNNINLIFQQESLMKRFSKFLGMAGLAAVIGMGATQSFAASPWYAEYFNWRHYSDSLNAPRQVFFEAPVLARWESSIASDWGSGSPASEVGNDYFAVAWHKSEYFDAGCYQFNAWVDDGVRIFVDGRQISNEFEWRIWSQRDVTAKVCLTAGDHHVRAEYFERDGQALMFLNWHMTSSTQPPVVVDSAGIRMGCLPVWTEHSPYYVKVLRIESDGVTQTVVPQVRPDGSTNPNGVWANNDLKGKALTIQPLAPFRTYRLIFGRGADHLAVQDIYLQPGTSHSSLGIQHVSWQEKASLGNSCF